MSGSAVHSGERAVTPMREVEPLRGLVACGQSPWLDLIRRDVLDSGALARMVEEWGVRGVTSNPTLFEQAIGHGDVYLTRLAELATKGCSAAVAYETLVVEDIVAAADVLRSVYDSSGGSDGFVSLEISPHLVDDAAGTIVEARRFWRLLDRPNVMIKVPGTREGLRAVRQLLAEGINVNITLLFSLGRYRRVLDAYFTGLEEARAAGRDLERIASVASFFLSRIDSFVDPLLDQVVMAGGEQAAAAQQLKGEVSLASARRAYTILQSALRTERYEQLALHGARPQRLLWASTGTKNPAYDPLKYVEPLIGPDTVTTLPLATLEAYRVGGAPQSRLKLQAEGALQKLAMLDRLGIELRSVTDGLLREGVRRFAESYDSLQRMLEHKLRQCCESR
jgi:transaldolase